MRTRKAILKLADTIYRDKQECLDHLEYMRKNQLPMHGIEVVILKGETVETNHYKTVWYSSQKDVYDMAAAFIKEQMVGAWNYAELKC